MMTLVLGASGHVGLAVAQALRRRGEPVLAVAHSPSSLDRLHRLGFDGVVADARDGVGMRAVLARGQRLFLLNPPASPSGDPDRDERESALALIEAVAASDLERVVAESSYGVQRGAHLGDLGVLFDLEQALARQSRPWMVIRAAYYMSNWGMQVKTAKDDGEVHGLFPVDFSLPMVAPKDIGEVAAELITQAFVDGDTVMVEGPARYSLADVAAAFAKALNRPVLPVPTPRERWLEALAAQGFSPAAAQSFANMTAATLETRFVAPEQARRGRTALDAYVARLVDDDGRRAT